MNFIIENWIEIVGALISLIYLVLSVKQNIWTWAAGIACSLLYVVVFLDAKFYADMTLQVYYVLVSIYGWYFWAKGNPNKQMKTAEVSRTPGIVWLILFFVAMLCFVLIYFILNDYTDSPVPVGDAITTALSIVATWMLARKYLEHWILWIFIDAFSAYLYFEKGLYPTVILFVVYTMVAMCGFVAWNNQVIDRECKIREAWEE
ncbi:MAG: nicotinamide riboside transporter PnuC [Mangrovibacterium sp.]